MKDLNRVVDEVRRRNQNREKSRDVSDKLSLYPGGNLLFLRIDAIAIASASDSKLHQKVVRLGGTGLETEVKSKVCNKKLNPGDVVETKGHNLLAKRVMHCATSGIETGLCSQCRRCTHHRGHTEFEQIHNISIYS